jgi:large subunit ribosomal protein L21
MSMYAVVTTGGKQYRVEAGSTLVVEKLVGEPGSSVTFDRVLLVGDGETVTVGTPTVAGASVEGTVLGPELGPKIVVFKFKQKVKYRRRTGHRQHLTRVRIDAISADGRTVRAEAPAAKPRQATRKKASAAATGEPAPATKRATRGRSASAATAAEAPAAKPRRATRKKASAAATGEPAPATKRATRGRSASAATAAEATKRPASRSRATASEPTKAEAAEPKPRARRAAKPKAETAKEE